MLSGKISCCINWTWFWIIFKAWLFFDKNRSLGLLVTNICKNRTIKISLFNYSMVAYILPVAISLPPRLLKESLDESHIFKSTVHTDNLFSYSMLPRKISDKFTIIYLGPLQMFTTMSNLLYNIWRETWFYYCQP